MTTNKIEYESKWLWFVIGFYISSIIGTVALDNILVGIPSFVLAAYVIMTDRIPFVKPIQGGKLE